MSEYTLELNEVQNKLLENDTTIFNFDYDLPDFMNKNELQNQFLAHYYFREIGLETISRWVQRFQTAWLEKLAEYTPKFIACHEQLDSEELLNTYNTIIRDTSTYKATPMSSLDPTKNYATNINKVEGQHTGFTGNLYRIASEIIKEHTEVINNFIMEFDYLFMGVL